MPAHLTSRRSLLLGAAGLATSSALAGCALPGSEASTAAKGKDGKVVLRYQGWANKVLGPELAEDLGYFDVVRLKWVGATISGPQDIQSVATNQTDVGGAFTGAVVNLIEAQPPSPGKESIMTTQRQLHLNAFIMPNGHHEAAWRHPSTRPEQALTLQHYVDIARTAERGRLDSVFLADTVALADNVRHNSHSAFEPLTLRPWLRAPSTSVSSPPRRRPTTTPTLWLGPSPRSTTSAGVAPGGTSSPRARRPRRATSGSSARTTRAATTGRPSSSSWPRSCGTASGTVRSSPTRSAGSSPTRIGSGGSSTAGSSSR